MTTTPGQLTCAVCLWLQFLDVELDSPLRHHHSVKPAATTIDGTTLCALHIEDYHRTRDPFVAAEIIERVGNPEGFSRYKRNFPLPEVHET